MCDGWPVFGIAPVLDLIRFMHVLPVLPYIPQCRSNFQVPRSFCLMVCCGMRGARPSLFNEALKLNEIAFCRDCQCEVQVGPLYFKVVTRPLWAKYAHADRGGPRACVLTCPDGSTILAADDGAFSKGVVQYVTWLQAMGPVGYSPCTGRCRREAEAASLGKPHKVPCFPMNIQVRL